MGNSNRLAVIDLGSNTFHLLIVDLEYKTNSFTEVYRQRDFVYLSKGGISVLDTEDQERGLASLASFQEIIIKTDTTTTICVGTAALRTAVNGANFIATIKAKLGLDISVIDGLREAELIYKGISLTGRFDRRSSLIMDIGGGSVEFVLVMDNKVIFAKSYRIGITVLRNKFRASDPICSSDLARLYGFLDNELKELLVLLQEHQPQFLVGASGPFEIVEKAISLEPSSSGNIIQRQIFIEYYDNLMGLAKEARGRLPGMSPERADLSLESMLLINYILCHSESIREVLVSPFALKEGIISEALNLD